MNVAVYIARKDLLNDKLFCVSNARDNAIERFCLLKERLISLGHKCHTQDQYKYADIDLILINRFDLQLKFILNVVKRNPNVKIVYHANEVPMLAPLHSPEILGRLPVDLVFTWNETATKKFSHVIKSNIGEPFIIVKNIPKVKFEKKKLCCAIFGNKRVSYPRELYSARLQAIEFFSQHSKEFDLFGMGWNTAKEDFIKLVNRGPVESKIQTLKEYKYSICFENVYGEPGLITEKIFDCFAAGCVPIYYGNEKFREIIPENCYINFREFNDYNELYHFLTNISANDYQNYLDSVNNFLKSKEYYKFTSRAFVDLFLESLGSITTKKKSLIWAKYTIFTLIIKNLYFFFKNSLKIKKFYFDLLSTW